MILKYRSGKDIRRGDRVRFHGDSAEIEFVAVGAGDPETEWYFHEFGGGIMISGLKVFIPANQLDETEDLEFVSRAGAAL
jgi:hypothetical protein